MEQILIIDDTQAIRAMLAETLMMAGYRVLVAEGVTSGIACALDCGPDLILCDVMLADGQGAPTSVFLKRSDVSSMLRKPLQASFASQTPTIGTMPQREIDLVNQLTLPRLYSFDVQRAQDGSAVLVYDPVVLGA